VKFSNLEITAAAEDLSEREVGYAVTAFGVTVREIERSDQRVGSDEHRSGGNQTIELDLVPRLLLALLLALVAGIMAIYLLGVSVLYLNLNLVQQKAVSLSTAVKIGFILPLPGDLIKIAVVLYLGPLMHQRFRLARMDVSG